MAKMGDIDMHFNQAYFDTILKEPGVDGLCEEKAKQALQIASATAPVVTQVWGYIGELVFNLLVLVGMVKMSDRIVREMMGL